MNINDIVSLNRSSKYNILDLSNLNLKFDIKNDLKKYNYIFIKNNYILICELYNNPKIIWIDLSNTFIKKCYLNLSNLEFLDLSKNNITDLKIKLPNLKYLNLNNNKLEIIPSTVYQMKNLNVFKISNNNIKYIDILDFSNLQIIEMENNSLNSIDFIKNCKYCEKIIANNNNIDNFNSLVGFNNLYYLNLKNNNITNIPKFIINMTNLKIVNLSNNKISYIDNDFKNIKFNMYVYNNNFNMKDDLLKVLNGNNIFLKLKIFDDNQNVHDVEIQNCLKKNITILYENKIIYYDLQHIIEDCDLKNCEFIIYKNIIKNEKYNKHDLNYLDILNLIYNKIKNNEDKKEICKIINEEIIKSENEDLCFIGKISRLINCLSGFCEDICFKMTDNDQIYNIMTILKSKYSDKNELKSKLLFELGERNYDKKIVQEWIDNLDYL